MWNDALTKCQSKGLVGASLAMPLNLGIINFLSLNVALGGLYNQVGGYWNGTNWLGLDGSLITAGFCASVGSTLDVLHLDDNKACIYAHSDHGHVYICEFVF